MTIKPAKPSKPAKPLFDKIIASSKIYFQPGLVWFIESSVKPQLEKKPILAELANLLANTSKVPLAQDALVEKLLHRELEESTYLGNGVALPHCTLADLPGKVEGVLAIIKFSKPIAWGQENKARPHSMEAMKSPISKSKMVDMVWGLVSSEEHHLKNLKFLTQILGNTGKVRVLRESKNSTDFFKLLTGKKQTKNIVEHNILDGQTKIFESSFLMPPHWEFHARPATALVQYVKKLLSPFYSDTKSAKPRYSLWIKYKKRFAPAINLAEILSLGIEPNKKISFLITSTGKKSASPNTIIAERIIKQAKAFLLHKAIKELQDMNYSVSPGLNHAFEIESNTEYKKTIADFKKTSIGVPSVEIKLRSFGSTSSIPRHSDPLQLTPVFLYAYQHQQDYLNPPKTTSPDKSLTKSTTTSFSTNLSLLEHAIVETRKNIVHEREKLIQQAPSYKSQDILSAHHELLNSQTLIEEVKSYYYSHLDNLKHHHAIPPIIQIWEQVIKRKIKFFRASPSPLLQARVDDWRDLEGRVALKLWELLETAQVSSTTTKPPSSPAMSSLSGFLTAFFEKKNPSSPYTLIAEEFLPSQVVELSPYIKKGFIKTVILKHFNPHSHATIMLANYQVAVYGLKEPTQFEKLLAMLSDSEKILINTISPAILMGGLNNISTKELSKCNQEIVQLIEKLKPYPLPGLFDKHRLASIPKSVIDNLKSLEFLVNINNKHDVELLQEAIKSNPRNVKNNIGIGLFRSGLYFAHRKKTPSLAEQVKVYSSLAKLCYPAPVVIRTIDIAKDKLIPFLKPALDEPSHGHFFANSKRIKYFSKTERAFVKEQIRALSTAAQEWSNLQVLFPMVAGQEDFFIYLEILGEHRSHLKCGVMIESPALLYELPLLNSLVDFYSIGTNDLTKFLNLEPREKQAFDEPNNYMNLLLALEHISRSTYNLPQLPHPTKTKAIPLILCGNHATNQSLLYEFIELGICRFSVPLAVFHQLNKIKEFFKNKKFAHKPIKKNHAHRSENNGFSNLKDLRHYLFNPKKP